METLTRPLKIMADAMFGKLGKFLRILGFDTEIAPNNWMDPKVLEESMKDHRLLITRDKEFYSIAQIKLPKNGMSEKFVFYTQETGLVEQLTAFFQHVKHLEITLKQFIDGVNNYRADQQKNQKNPENTKLAPLEPRCAKCNSQVVRESKEALKDRINSGTYEHFEIFWECSNANCKQIYWAGRHWEEVYSMLMKVEAKMAI